MHDRQPSPPEALQLAPQQPRELTDFIESTDAPEPFEVEGVNGKLYCKIMSITEAEAVLRLVNQPNANTVISYCAAAVVRKDGTPFADTAQWGRWPIKDQNILLRIFKACQRINGNVPSEEVAEAGKPSAEMLASA